MIFEEPEAFSRRQQLEENMLNNSYISSKSKSGMAVVAKVDPTDNKLRLGTSGATSSDEDSNEEYDEESDMSGNFGKKNHAHMTTMSVQTNQHYLKEEAELIR